jgi:hypothetical protein
MNTTDIEPQQVRTLRGKLSPRKVLVVDGHHNFELAWYHNGKYYAEDPRDNDTEIVDVILWDYLPKLSRWDLQMLMDAG